MDGVRTVEGGQTRRKALSQGRSWDFDDENVYRHQRVWTYRTAALILVYGVVGTAIVIRNLAGLTVSPPGLYVDESSIGYNAWALAHHGVDEHGVAFPLYPEAFGEYKNPVYIYLLAALLRVASLSVFTIRLPAALLGLVACVAITLAVHRITRSHAAAWATLLISGTAPWLTQESRLGFEVISMVALLSLMVWFLAEAQSRTAGRESGVGPWYAAAGIAAALAIFAYSTGRLEVGLLVVALVAAFAYPWRSRWWTVLKPCAVGYVVLGVWGLQHPGALTARYDLISITVNHATGMPRTVAAVWALFWSNYWQYVGPGFLFVHGDLNIRHNTGWGGMLFASTAVLLVAGILWSLRHAAAPVPRFILLCLPLAPIAAALTDNGTPHSLRAATMLPFLLIVAGVGVHACIVVVRWLLHQLGVRGRAVAVTPAAVAILVAAVTLGSAVPYTANMYRVYPQRAAPAFDGGELDAIVAAHQLAYGHTVYLVADGYLDQPYIQAAYAFATSLVPPRAPTEDQAAYLLRQIGMVQVTDVRDIQSPKPGDVVVMAESDPAPRPPHSHLALERGVVGDYVVGA